MRRTALPFPSAADPGLPPYRIREKQFEFVLDLLISKQIPTHAQHDRADRFAMAGEFRSSFLASDRQRIHAARIGIVVRQRGNDEHPQKGLPPWRPGRATSFVPQFTQVGFQNSPSVATASSAA